MNSEYRYVKKVLKLKCINHPKKKFICTYLRPTQLEYAELYEYHGCAKFVADYIDYRVLEPPYDLVRMLFFIYSFYQLS